MWLSAQSCLDTAGLLNATPVRTHVYIWGTKANQGRDVSLRVSMAGNEAGNWPDSALLPSLALTNT